MPENGNDRIRQLAAAPADAGRRLDAVLAAHLGGLSRTRLKALIAAGRVSADGATILDPASRVKSGQRLVVSVPAPEAAAPAPEAIALAIVYEDRDLVVVDKPAGLVVHPAPGNPAGTLVNALLAHCGDSLGGIGGVRRPGIVHRLDKDTSGLMVVAKTEAAYAGLVRQFHDRTIHRIYCALAWGVPRPGEGDIAGAIGRHPVNRKKMAVLAAGGRAALTHYRVLRAYGGIAALLDCRLATGRTHQIRVHLAHAGHPLVGDPLYGGGPAAARRRPLPPALRDTVAGFPRQALHARALGFVHPIGGNACAFESAVPPDLQALINSFESL